MKCLLASISAMFVFAYSLTATLVFEKTYQKKSIYSGSEKVILSFPFVVVNEPTTIQSIKSSCGCTTAQMEKMSFNPGENSKIQVIFDPKNRSGKQQKSVTLITDDPNRPEISLSVEVDIVPTLEIAPRFVYWSKGSNSFEKKKVKLVANSTKEVEILGVNAGDPLIHVELITIDERNSSIEIEPLFEAGRQEFFRGAVDVTYRESDGEIQKQTVYVFVK